MNTTQRVLLWVGGAVVVLILGWIVFAAGRASAPSTEKKTEVVEQKTTTPASTSACPAGYSCTPKKTDAELVAEAIDRLGGRLAAQATPPAPKARRQVAATPIPAPAGTARKVQISCEAAGLKEIALPVSDSRCKRLPNGVIRCPNVCG